VILDKGQRQCTRPPGVAIEKDSVVRYEDVIEDRHRFHHLVAGADRPFARTNVAIAKGAGQQLHAGGVDRQGKGNAPVGLPLAHCPRGQYDDFIHIGRYGSVDLCAANDDTILPARNNTQVKIGIGLVCRPFHPIALHVRLGRGERQIVVAAVLVKHTNALVVHRIVHLRGDREQREQRIRTDLLDQHDQGVAFRRCRLDQPGAQKQVFGVGWNFVVATVGLSALGYDSQIAVGSALGHFVVDGRVFDCFAHHGVRRDIRYALTPKPDLAVVAERSDVLVRCAKRHGDPPVLVD